MIQDLMIERMEEIQNQIKLSPKTKEKVVKAFVP